MALRFIITGGTIDDLEYSTPENAPKAHNSLVPDLLKEARLTVNYSIENLMAKDSKFVTDEDRKQMALSCEKADEDQIIITHGTMTMPETAKYLGERSIPKTIVLLGAAVPGNQDGSDALFNLGSAVSAAQLLEKGVYIAMNGKIFNWRDVKKNFEAGVFETES